MTEIPEDVMKAAEQVWEETWENYQGDHDSDPVGVIARAILAERERCAKVAYAYADSHSSDHKMIGHIIGRNILYGSHK